MGGELFDRNFRRKEMNTNSKKNSAGGTSSKLHCLKKGTKIYLYAVETLGSKRTFLATSI